MCVYVCLGACVCAWMRVDSFGAPLCVVRVCVVCVCARALCRLHLCACTLVVCAPAVPRMLRSRGNVAVPGHGGESVPSVSSRLPRTLHDNTEARTKPQSSVRAGYISVLIAGKRLSLPTRGGG